MEADEAIKTIIAYSWATVRVADQTNSKRGLTKKAMKEERDLAKELFVAIVGREPTAQEAELLVMG